MSSATYTSTIYLLLQLMFNCLLFALRKWTASVTYNSERTDVQVVCDNVIIQLLNEYGIMTSPQPDNNAVSVKIKVDYYYNYGDQQGQYHKNMLLFAT